MTEREEENGILPLGLNENIDAIFCIKMLPPEYMQKLVNLGYRIFQLDHYCGIEQRPMGDIVRVDGVQPVSLLTSHLIGQGMTRIGFLSEHSSTYESMHDRYVGFLAAMEQAGIPLDEELVRPNMESDHFYYPENFDKIVASYDTLPEAIVCGNDMIAKRLTESFRKIGVRVPEDVALTDLMMMRTGCCIRSSQPFMSIRSGLAAVWCMNFYGGRSTRKRRKNGFSFRGRLWCAVPRASARDRKK